MRYLRFFLEELSVTELIAALTVFSCASSTDIDLIGSRSATP